MRPGQPVNSAGINREDRDQNGKDKIALRSHNFKQKVTHKCHEERKKEDDAGKTEIAMDKSHEDFGEPFMDHPRQGGGVKEEKMSNRGTW